MTESLFGTAGIRGDVTTTVTPELALAVGQAAGRDGTEFVVGRDGRETGEALAAAVESGLLAAGADVERVGQVPTPALAFASQGRRGVMVTASHNPPSDNGLKLFVDGVEYDAEAERRVERRVDESPGRPPWDEWGDGSRFDVLPAYREAIVAFVVEQFGHEPLTGTRIAIDCGNGMAGVATPWVLRALGAEVVAADANVDGHFPARESKPTPESLSGFREFVADDPAVDHGIAHDGDADRVVVVGPDGEVVHEDTVVAVVADHYVSRAEATTPTVVTTPNASARIDERVEAAGGRTERVRLGSLHEGIARARADGQTVAFAAEPWKHIHTAFGGWIDGVASAAVVSALATEAGGIASLTAPVTERPYRKESVRCPETAKDDVMAAVERRLPERYPDGTVDTDYGVRVDRPDGSWVLVRPSGTEPYVRIYVESEDVDRMMDTALEVVRDAVPDE